MRRFVAVFRAAHETLMDSEKDLQYAVNFVSMKNATVVQVSSVTISDEEEEELWDKLCDLDTGQLTAVMEDAGAVLWRDKTFIDWLQFRRTFERNGFATNLSLDRHVLWRRFVVQVPWRRFVPDYADVFAAVNTWMDERDGVEREGWWERQVWKVLGALDEWRWWAVTVLVIYEIANLVSFVLTLELSGWARYNLWAYLVLHSAAFFKLLWMYLSVFVSATDKRVWSGNCAEADLLLVSIAVLVRTRRQNPSSFPKISLLNIMRDARCVFTVEDRTMGLNNLIAPECPHGTATMAVGAQSEAEGITRGVGNLAAWQVDRELHFGIGLASKPEPNSSNPEP